MTFVRINGHGLSLVALLLCICALVAAGCGGTTASDSNAQAASGSCVTKDKHFAKTQFALSAGGAAFAFHRYIYKPLREGAFKKTNPDRKKAFVKAGVASAFIVAALKNARDSAQSDERLCKYVPNMDKFNASVTALAAKFKGGNAKESDITDTNSALDALQKSAGFKDRSVPVPGAG